MFLITFQVKYYCELCISFLRMKKFSKAERLPWFLSSQSHLHEQTFNILQLMQTCWMHTNSFYTLPPRPFLWLCRSYFGREYEVICHTYLDSHRVEEDKNYWVIVTGNPGDEGGTMLHRPEPQPGGKGKNEFHEETKNVKIPDSNWHRLLRFWFLFFWFSHCSIWNVYFKKRYGNLP